MPIVVLLLLLLLLLELEASARLHDLVSCGLGTGSRRGLRGLGLGCERGGARAPGGARGGLWRYIQCYL